jgi:signal peptidase II
VKSVAPKSRPSIWNRLALVVALAVVALDQLSKGWALQSLPPDQPREFWPGVLNLRLVYNTGAAFSLFTGSPRWLALVSLVVSAAVLVWILRQPLRGLAEGLGFGFLLGGALGNGLDRWRLGAVVDFLALVPIQFPVFNLADVAINLAVLCFLARLSRSKGSDGQTHG